MQAIALGPLALPLAPLLLLAGWWLAGVVAGRLAAPRRAEAGRWIFRAVLAGLGVARLVFVAQGWPGYAAAPLSVLDVRDGGWSPWPGVAAALAVLAYAGWRHGALRRGLAAGAVAGLALWAGLSAVLGVHDRPALPALTLADLQGQPLPLRASGDARPMVVNLWATWCAPCRAEMPILAAAAQRQRGVRFVFVNHGETPAAVRAFLAQQPYRLDELRMDPAMRLGAAVQSPGLPTTLFVDAHGTIVARHMGPLTAAALAARIETLTNP